MRTPEFVAYSPSKATGFGHAFRRRGVGRAWEDFQHFLSACTDATPPTELELDVERPTEWDDDVLMGRLIDHAFQHFGAPSREALDGGTRWPSGELLRGGRYTWTRTGAQLDGDVAYLIQGEPWPKTTIGPVTLRMSQTFTWKRGPTLPSLARAHPDAPPGGGHVTLSLGRKCFLQPSLAFPFVHDEPALLDFLKELQVHLPFRMHKNHFRRVWPGNAPHVVHSRTLPFEVLLA